MSTPKFAETHNLVAFLEKPEESNGFEEIIDFLNASSVQYALTVNPTIYTTCIEQFWTSAKVKTVNGERQIQALVDKKKVIISETSIRSDLKLDDAEGTYCLPTATIFAELERMGYENLTQKLISHPNGNFSSIPYCNALVLRLHPGMNLVALWHLLSYVLPQTKNSTFPNLATPTDSHSTPIITQPSSSKLQKKKSRRKQRKDSAPTKHTTEKTTPEEHVSTPSYDPPPSAKEITSLKKRVKQLEKRRKSRTSRLRRLRKVGSSSRVESSNDATLGAQEDASKQGRKIKDLDADAKEIKFEKVVEEPIVSVATTTKSIPVSAADVVTTASASVVILDESTLAQTLIEIKTAKPKPVTTAATTSGRTQACYNILKDKGEGKMVEPEVPLKKKDQVALDEEMARNLEAQLQAELIKEERFARQKEEEANIALIESWDNIQAVMEADFELAQRLQAEERGEITIEERSRLFVELMHRRKKHFAKLRAKSHLPKLKIEIECPPI
ncbi:hypothetical protein Tco_0656950 [Tanacetum coccineum]|uniref:Xylulose kinase-1 n=1 Tax=Tanacetum coccineum TaxID=301880 RepID=A0ABQ4XAG1_9ASTR